MMKILVAVDESEESQRALQYACHLMAYAEAKVDAVYVKPDEADMGPETLYAPFVGKDAVKEWIEKKAESVAEEVLSSCGVCDSGKISCWPRILVGEPAEEILNAAHTEKYDMIVLGAQASSSIRGFLLGAVQAKILHHARLPVLIVRNFREIKRVLVAYRGSDCDQGAVEFIASLLLKRKPEITILHVQENKAEENDTAAKACLLKGEQKLKEFDHTPITKMTKGNFTDEILKEVATGRYDLVVLGAYGHKRPKYFGLISDEALDIARLTTRPVLVYRDMND